MHKIFNAILFLFFLSGGLCYGADSVRMKVVRAGFTSVGKPAVRMADENIPDNNLEQCGRHQVNHVGLIVGGNSTNPGDWPWHVALFKLKGNTQNYICGGALLSKTVVLTAGHCVTENGAAVNPDCLLVAMGKHKRIGSNSETQERGVYKVIVHQKYGYLTLENDIALLKLTSEVKYSAYIQPVCLWNDNEMSVWNMTNQIGTIVGWGMNEKEELSSELMMIKLPVHDNFRCVKTYPLFFSLHLNENTFCAGFGNGTGPCNGDSGGGMYFEKRVAGETIWYLKGITSLTVSRSDKSACDLRFYTVMTDAAKYLDFIKKNMG